MRVPFLSAFVTCSIILGAIGAARAGDGLCPLTGDQTNCVRILACYGEEGRWFHGRAFGRGAGTLAGVMDDGVACTGTWTARNVLGLGQADVSCDDGATIRVIYFYQDEWTGTARGSGRSSTGARVQSWSGEHVLDYFRSGSPTGEARLRCGEHDIPLS